MVKSRKVVVTAEYDTVFELWSTATYLCDIGAARTKGMAHPFLAASAFAFFAFEAFLNDLGSRMDPETWKVERSFFSKPPYQGTFGKFRYLAEKAGHTYSASNGPFQTVQQLGKLRDLLAHGRVEILQKTVRVNQADGVLLTSTIRKAGEAAVAKRALRDVAALADGLFTSAKKNCGREAAGFRFSAFSGPTGSRHTKLIDD